MLTLAVSRRWRGAASSLLAVTTIGLAACSDANTTAPLASPADASFNRSASHGPSDDRGTDRPGAVYTLTNGVEGNAVVAFRRATDGALTRIGSFTTGGKGI